MVSAIRSALVSHGRPSKVPNTGALNNRNIPSQFWRPEVRDRGASGAMLSPRAVEVTHRKHALAALSGKYCSHGTFLSRLLLGQLQAASPSPCRQVSEPLLVPFNDLRQELSDGSPTAPRGAQGPGWNSGLPHTPVSTSPERGGQDASAHHSRMTIFLRKTLQSICLMNLWASVADS